MCELNKINEYKNLARNAGVRYFVIVFIIFYVLCTNTMYSQSSFSVNYLYNGGREKYTSIASKQLVKHGIGIQSKMRLKNRFYLLPDIAYFFTDYEKEYYGKSFRETRLKYYAINVNLGYSIPLTRTFLFLPFAGFGYLHEDSWQYLHIVASNPPPTGGTPRGGNADIIDKQNASSLPCNLGFNLDFFSSENIFFTVGMKYMIDIYDTKYNCFPHINIGIGYSF
jgi:hypothetical protein